MISVAFGALNASLSPPRHFLSGWQRSVYLIVATGLWMWTFPMTYHVFNRFPDWKPTNLPSRTMQWLVYGIGATIIWPTSIISDLGLDVFDAATGFLLEHPRLYLTSARISGSSGRGMFLFMVVCLALALIASARHYRRLDREDSRRRIPWVLAGLAVGVIPFIVLTFASRVVAWISDANYGLYIPITFLALLGIPASIVMAVWKEQLVDIRVLVRRGLQYLFARAALRTLLALPMVALAFSIFSNPDRTIGQLLMQGSGGINLVLIGAVTLALQSRQRLQTSLDRRFFREAYEQEQVLTHLIDEVRQLGFARRRGDAREQAPRVGAASGLAAHLLSCRGAQRALRRPFIVRRRDRCTVERATVAASPPGTRQEHSGRPRGRGARVAG
jgi:hypothetical protein